MNAEEAIRVAAEAAKAAGWGWTEPVIARRGRKWILFGPVSWHVTSNANMLGQNVNITIDDASGRITSKGFAPR